LLFFSETTRKRLGSAVPFRLRMVRWARPIKIFLRCFLRSFIR
jgi:hypothetical protein